VQYSSVALGSRRRGPPIRPSASLPQLLSPTVSCSVRHFRFRCAELLESGGQVFLRFAELGIELESLLKRGDGSLHFPLSGQRYSQVVVGLGP